MVPRKHVADVAGAGALLGLAVLLAFARSFAEQAPPGSVYSTYDTRRNGYGALYELLRQEGVRVQRFEQPVGLLPDDVRTLVISSWTPDVAAGLRPVPLDRNDVVALKLWIARGGRLVVLDREYGGVEDAKLGFPGSFAIVPVLRWACAPARAPYSAGVGCVRGSIADVFKRGAKRGALPIVSTRRGDVAIAYALGRGEVVAVTDPTIFSNVRLRDGGNARLAYNLLAGPSTTSQRQTVAFDERVHGYVADKSFWDALPRSVHWAIFIVLATVALALVGANVRFAPALVLDPPAERDTSAYIASMANLLARGRAAAYAIGVCVDATVRALQSRFGFAERGNVAALRERLARKDLQEAFDQLMHLRSLEQPTDADLVRAGMLSARLGKDL